MPGIENYKTAMVEAAFTQDFSRRRHDDTVCIYSSASGHYSKCAQLPTGDSDASADTVWVLNITTQPLPVLSFFFFFPFTQQAPEPLLLILPSNLSKFTGVLTWRDSILLTQSGEKVDLG